MLKYRFSRKRKWTMGIAVEKVIKCVQNAKTKVVGINLNHFNRTKPLGSIRHCANDCWDRYRGVYGRDCIVAHARRTGAAWPGRSRAFGCRAQQHRAECTVAVPTERTDSASCARSRRWCLRVDVKWLEWCRILRDWLVCLVDCLGVCIVHIHCDATGSLAAEHARFALFVCQQAFFCGC